MPFCGNCGNEYEDGTKFCPSCGAPTAAQEDAPNDFSRPAPAPTTLADGKDNSSNMVMGILCYLGILVLIPIFAAKDSKFVRFHANQGLILLLVEVAYGIATWLVTLIISIVSPRLGFMVGSLLHLVNYAFLVLMILGIINVVKGIEKELPIIGVISLLH
jgi:uncharacterized membrane protein